MWSPSIPSDGLESRKYADAGRGGNCLSPVVPRRRDLIQTTSALADAVAGSPLLSAGAVKSSGHR